METVTSPVGPLLRAWRQRRHFSQLDLSIEAGVSSRHLSFVETGRARPSRSMVLQLAATLDVPKREQNQLLVAAGFAPAYAERPLDDPEMSRLQGGDGATPRGVRAVPVPGRGSRLEHGDGQCRGHTVARGHRSRTCSRRPMRFASAFIPEGLAPQDPQSRRVARRTSLGGWPARWRPAGRTGSARCTTSCSPIPEGWTPMSMTEVLR